MLSGGLEPADSAVKQPHIQASDRTAMKLSGWCVSRHVLTHRDVKLTLLMEGTVTSHVQYQYQCAAGSVQTDSLSLFDPLMYRYCSQYVFSVAVSCCVTTLYQSSIVGTL